MIFSRTVLLIFSVLIIGQNVSSKQYTVEMLIDDVSFIPGARFVLTAAHDAWDLYNELKCMAPTNTTENNKQLGVNKKSDIIDTELRELSIDLHTLSGNVNELESTITDKVEIDQPSQNLLYILLEDFHKQIREVNRLFNRMQEFDKTKFKLENYTYDIFVNNVLDVSHGQLSSALDAIHDALTGGNDMLDILTKNHLTNTLVCRDGVSPLYRINHLYEAAMKAYTKGIVLNEFAYAHHKDQQNRPDGFKGELDLLIKRFCMKTFEIVEKIKIFMARASSAYWKCNGVDLENVTYAKLGPIFQKYFLKEQDAKDDHIKCMGTCEKRKDLVITDECKTNFCKQQTKCSGVLVGCQKSHSCMNICLADPSSGRRYHYIEGKEKDDRVYEVFGKKNKCRKYIQANQKDWKMFECEFCQCTCLSHQNITDIDRYFSLKKVMSDVKNNKVVTGVRFVKRNHIFHIQIEEGTLLKDGIIDKNSISWKPVHNFSIHDHLIINAADYHAIEWEKRTVHLDDLESTGDKVLTGLRFKLVRYALQLEIQVTPFDFSSGKLDIRNSEWITKENEQERTEIDMSERNLPRANTYRYLDSEDNQFLKFTTSSFKDDVGQTIVPYIDLGEVTTEVRTPLSGAGLIHQANAAESGGFLSFKLFNYNYVHHLRNK